MSGYARAEAGAASTPPPSPWGPSTDGPAAPVRVVVVSDPGADLDDEMAAVLLRSLVDDGLVEPVAVVCNLHPSDARARLMRGMLDALGLDAVPVGVGSDGGDRTHEDSFSELASAYAVPPSTVLPTGAAVLRAAFENAAPHSLTLLCISALTDAAALLRSEPALFLAKVREVVIMGGATYEGGALVPDSAANNEFDPGSAAFLYEARPRRGQKPFPSKRETTFGDPEV